MQLRYAQPQPHVPPPQKKKSSELFKSLEEYETRLGINSLQS